MIFLWISLLFSSLIYLLILFSGNVNKNNPHYHYCKTRSISTLFGYFSTLKHREKISRRSNTPWREFGHREILDAVRRQKYR